MKASKAHRLVKPSPTPIPRRSFLVTTAAVALSLAIVEALRITLAYLKPLPTKGFGGEFNLGPVEDLAAGSVTQIRQGRFSIVHNDDGFLALYQKCTHLGCLVRWNDESGHFACPCHAGHYNKEGEVISGPPPKPLGQFKLEIINGEVIVDTSKVIPRDRYEPAQTVRG